MISNSPTFCAAPWTGLNIDQTGRVSQCMHSFHEIGNIKKNSVQEIIHGPILAEIKQTMLEGKWHDTCRICKYKEETTGISGRTVMQHSEGTIDNINKDINWFELQHLAINWSNLCNLSCTYCNPDTSTAWQGVKKIPISYVQNKHDDLIELAKEQGHKIQGLTLGGGEPLLQKNLINFLKLIDSTQVRAMVTTNLSVDITTNEIYQELKTWKNIHWQVSFDNANKDKFEYVRNGANWELFEANLKIMKADNQIVQAHPAYSIYCAFDLLEYYDYCVEHGLEIYWCDLSHPFDLDVRKLSMPIRHLAAAEIDKVIEKYGDKFDLAINILEGYKNQLLNNPIWEPKINPLEFSLRIEQELQKTKTFTELWPNVVEYLNRE